MHAAALALGTILLFSWVSPDAARAEFFFDLYVGGNVTRDTDGTIKIGPAVGRGPIDFKVGPSGGFRGGYWFDSVPWVGLALGMPAYDPIEDDSDFDFYVFPIAALLMLRYPLRKDSDFPQGRLQPYAGVGPGAFFSRAKLDLSSLGAPEDLKDWNVDLGVNVVAGVKFHVWSGAQSALSGSLAIFVEYGFTHLKPSDYKDNIGGVPVELGIDRLDTHHAVAGVGFHF